jgi:hypothetical protein
MGRSKSHCLAPIFLLGSLAPASALTVVNVNAPAINCVFNPSCSIPVTDSVGNIPVPGIAGTARLQSRTFNGAPGAPGAKLRGYEYRVDLSQAIGILNLPCVTALRLGFGTVAKLQYNGAGPLDDVYVVTGGGLGSVGLASATKVLSTVTFAFASPVCAGANPGAGTGTFFFGLASTKLPKPVTAQVKVQGGAWVNVPARSPGP